MLLSGCELMWRPKDSVGDEGNPCAGGTTNAMTVACVTCPSVFAGGNVNLEAIFTGRDQHGSVQEGIPRERTAFKIYGRLNPVSFRPCRQPRPTSSLTIYPSMRSTRRGGKFDRSTETVHATIRNIDPTTSVPVICSLKRS